jgi:hypothetical protein
MQLRFQSNYLGSFLENATACSKTLVATQHNKRLSLLNAKLN